MPEREWSHAGITRIVDNDSRSVKIPDMVRERGILTPGLPVYWSYETVVGIAIVSDSKLEKEEYKTVGYRKLQDEDNSHTVVVPSDFFFHEEMATSAPSSCYVLTDGEFNERFKDSDRWGGKLDDVPRFM